MVKRFMTDEDFYLSEVLHKVLNNETISVEDKVSIIKWFDTFEYRSKNDIPFIEGILTMAERLDW